jgi:hypothetical protein
MDGYQDSLAVTVTCYQLSGEKYLQNLPGGHAAHLNKTAARNMPVSVDMTRKWQLAIGRRRTKAFDSCGNNTCTP